MASQHEESSESDGESEPASFFQRRISTNKELRSAKCLKEGFLLKQTYAFQRWKKRYFKLKSAKLYYAKDSQSNIFNEVQLIDTCIAECSSKNMNNSFQPKMAAHELSSDHHNWCTFPQVRPMYCNVCSESLAGVIRSEVITLNGLSCEVCKFKTHKRCAAKATAPCKWTTMASMGDAVIEDENGALLMPHQWMLGNLPVNARCSVCDKACGSIRRLQDWTCLWCRQIVHAACKENLGRECTLGQARVSILPPTAITSLDLDGYWRATKPCGTSPLLVFINSKSGDNEGVKMLRKLKQLLNPAQVFDLIDGGPYPGLRLFQHFESFRVLVCGGDGSIGWVFNEIDKLGLHKQCQVGVLPLGTGNDLARVLGWGAIFDDETQLPAVLEKLEHAQIKMLDRWSVLCYESSVLSRRLSSHCDPIAAYEDSAANQLARILHSDSPNVVIDSAMVLCGIVKDLVAKVGSDPTNEDVGMHGDDSIGVKCAVLTEKLDALMETLNKESNSTSDPNLITTQSPTAQSPTTETDSSSESGSAVALAIDTSDSSSKSVQELETIIGSPSSSVIPSEPASSRQRVTSSKIKNSGRRKKVAQPVVFRPKEQLMSRANSLKKAIRQIIEHTEKAVDEQNNQTLQFECENAELTRHLRERPFPGIIIEGVPVSDDEPTSPISPRESETTTSNIPQNIPVIMTEELDDHPVPQIAEAEDDDRYSDTWRGCGRGLSSNMASLTVPHSTSSYSRGSNEALSYFPSEYSSACSTPGLLTPNGDRSPVFGRNGTDLRCVSPSYSSRSMKLEGKTGTRRISSLSMFNQSNYSLLSREKSPTKESSFTFPLLQSLSCNAHLGNAVHTTGASRSGGRSGGTGTSGSTVGGMNGFIGQLLLANADAMCAAASPLVEQPEDIILDELHEKCVMNNYFGIGLDAKISLDFHTKREEHPEKCRSRTKNMMWYGVLGGREIVHRTYKNMEQRVRLECDGQLIPLPNLQGIVVLNIPSYMGGTNFWGGSKEKQNFLATSFDDRILEVVAVFSSVQLGISRVINLQRHRIAQCRSVRITIIGDEGVPVQVDGEAWIQPPGFIYITHKNRAQMLTRDKVFEEALKTWTEKQKIERPVSPRHHALSDEEMVVLHSFIVATEALIRSVKLTSLCHSDVEQELSYLITQASGFLDRLYPKRQLAAMALHSEDSSAIKEPANRTQVSDLVSSVQTLYNDTQQFIANREKTGAPPLRRDVEETLQAALTSMEVEMKNVYVIGGLPHFQTADELEATSSNSSSSQPTVKEKNRSRWRFFNVLKKSDRTTKDEVPKPNSLLVRDWSTEEVSNWLHSLELDEYRDVFIAHDIRGKELIALGRSDLKELGITKVGHLKRIMQGIKDIKDKVSASLSTRANSAS